MTLHQITNLYSGDEVFSEEYISVDTARQKIQLTHKAFLQWKDIPLEKRIEHIQQGTDYFLKNKDDIAKSITAHMGKPITQSVQEVEVGVKKMLQLCKQAKDALQEIIEETPQFRYRTLREPKGVIDIVAPWNYPIFTALNGVVPALLAGNTVTLKHESVPPVGTAFERAFGKFQDNHGNTLSNLVTHLHIDIPTSNSILSECDEIQHRIFTGSVRAGEIMMELASQRAKNTLINNRFIGLSLELGGCDATYVAEDADLDKCIPLAIKIGRLHNTGQSCCCVKRSFVHTKQFNQFVEKAKQLMAEMKMGDPMDDQNSLGPLFGGEQKCIELYQMAMNAKAQGATIIAKGQDLTSLSDEDIKSQIVIQEKSGWFLVPTLVVFKNEALKNYKQVQCLTDETFGPILPVVEVLTDDEALNYINSTVFGLTSSVFTKQQSLVQRFMREINVGTVFVNWCNDVHPQVVWQGVKWSGNGAGALGSEGFRVLTVTKSLVESLDA